jgi:hypothetical protein
MTERILRPAKTGYALRRYIKPVICQEGICFDAESRIRVGLQWLVSSKPAALRKFLQHDCACLDQHGHQLMACHSGQGQFLPDRSGKLPLTPT